MVQSMVCSSNAPNLLSVIDKSPDVDDTEFSSVVVLALMLSSVGERVMVRLFRTFRRFSDRCSSTAYAPSYVLTKLSTKSDRAECTYRLVVILPCSIKVTICLTR